MKKYLFLLLFGILCVGPHAHASYTYYRSITVTSTTSIASGTQTNFPMLVSSTLSSWESSSTGGNIQNLCTAPNGSQEPCDLVFATSTNNCGTGTLSFETESYVSSTGALIDWVKMPTIATNTVIYACYGNSAATTDQSLPSSTWNSNYVGVWHFPNGTILNASDSTSNANNATTVSATPSNGVIDGGAAVTSTQTIIVPNSTSTNFSGAMTLDTWVYPTTSSTYQGLIVKETNSSTRQYALDLSTLGTGDLYFGDGGHKAADFAVNPGWQVNAWNHIVVTANGTTVTMYVNGALANTTATSSDASAATNQVSFGREATSSLYELFGSMDEARIMKVVASSSWVLTEYNNESSPNTFYAMGSENPIIVPTTTSITPTSTAAGGGNFILTVNGTNFLASSSVLWNGSARPTTFISSSQLTAIILGSDITAPSTASVTVSNPAPGGGTSNAQTFTITNPLPASSGLYNASGLLGHVDQNGNLIWTAGGTNNGPNAQGFNFVEGSALDLQNHRLFVSDNTNFRILVFPLDANNNLTTTTAKYVLGQPYLYASPYGQVATQDNTWNPLGLAYDPVNQRLFEAEQPNNRVMVFNVATSTITNGENASYVLGQTSFTSSTATTSQSGFGNNGLAQLAYDATNTRLFVADRNNDRILIFNVSTSTITNGENASYVLGQPNFTSSSSATTQNGMGVSYGIDYDPLNQQLFASDPDNNRILVFNVSTSTITNGENASYVLGQPNFTSSSSATTQNGLNFPAALAYDPVNQQLFANDEHNSRVLLFNVATSTITNGENASYVLGQPNFTSSSSATTQNGLTNPDLALSYDPTTGNLFVGDTTPVHRLMVFDAATSTITDGENAYGLLGHVDQNGNPLWTVAGQNNGPNAQGISGNAATTIDAVNHRLFVGEERNNRVLVFPLDANNNLTTTTPSYVLGQADFTSSIATTTQSSMDYVQALSYDASNQRLFVGDADNSRVLIFNVATSTITNGENASYVLGQPNFTSSSSSTTQNGFGIGSVQALSYDASNQRLFVGDRLNNRVLIFNVATSTITNGENASYVLGQPNFTSSSSATTQNGLHGPTGLDYDAVNNRLFVSDISNARVMVFNVATSTITNGENATNVLGQANFTSGTSGTTQSKLSAPEADAYDPIWNRLFVAEYNNTRVMVFNVATSTITNGENALNVLGQTTFTSNTATSTQSGFRNPVGVTYDPSHNRLFVSDFNNNRVMAFTFVTITTPSLPSGALSTLYSAPIVTTSTQGTVSFTLYNGSLPPGLSLDPVSGLISGTPTASGTYPFTVEADDTFTTGNFFDRAAYTTTIANPLAATPTFSPGAGTYSSAQSVTISCTTPSSTIYYTTDGSTPTPSSTPYTTPVTVASSETLNGICMATGYEDSAVGSAAYVIQAGGGGGGMVVDVPSGGSVYSPPPPPPTEPTSTPQIASSSLQTQLNALEAELQSLIAQQAAGNTAGTAYHFTRNLSLWDQSPDVTALQAYLIQHQAGPAAAKLTAHGTTQVFGILTYNALTEFQASVGIPATGYFGAITRAYVAAHE